MSVSVPYAPSFRMIRSQSGAIAVDPTGLTLSDYSLDEIQMPNGADDVLFYWTGQSLTGGDTLDIQAILLDSDNNRYAIGSTEASLAYETVAKISVYNSPFYLRVSAVSVTSATDLRIWAGVTVPPRRMA